MNTDLIKIFAMGCKYYAEEIEQGYIIPTYLLKEDNTHISIIKNRRDALIANESSFSKKFEEDIEKIKNELTQEKDFTKYIKEFPVPIMDRELWKEILTKEKVPKTRTELWEKHYILSDYFFYKAKFIVEIDSSFHDEKAIDDRVRDTYMYFKYGLPTYRFYEYGKSTIVRGKFYKSIKKNIKNSYSSLSGLNVYNNYMFDFSDIIVNNFIISNKGALEFIDKLYRYIGGYNNFKFRKGIILTLRDIYNIDSRNFGVFTNRDQLNMFLDNIIGIMRSVFKVSLHIHQSMLYTIEEVLWALSEKTNTSRWDNIRGTKIPYWITRIFGNPEQNDRVNWNNMEKEKIDDNIQELINNLQKFGYF